MPGDLLAGAEKAKEISQEKEKVRDAPAVARVKKYDSDWHFIVLDGGVRRNLKKGRQLAVRRGHEVLGIVEVDEVMEDESIAELVGKWRVDPKAAKPQSGDDVIAYPLF